MGGIIILLLKIFAFMLLAVGGIVVYSAKIIVSKLKLNEKVVCDFKNELTEEELNDYKMNKSIVNVKLIGFIIFLPGVVLLLVLFK